MHYKFNTSKHLEDDRLNNALQQHTQNGWPAKHWAIIDLMRFSEHFSRVRPSKEPFFATVTKCVTSNEFLAEIVKHPAGTEAIDRRARQQLFLAALDELVRVSELRLAAFESAIHAELVGKFE